MLLATGTGGDPMNGTPAVQLPFVHELASKVGRRRFRKQVLPIATVEHPKNGTLHFTPARLRALVERFKAGAYDTVPFLLADAENRHHDDIEKMRGEVKGLELTDEGLFADIETTDRGAKLLQDFPSLPVSVRLVPGRSGEALAHVLGTLDPVIRGMRAWETIEASARGQVLDLSRAVFEPDPATNLSTHQEAVKMTTQELIGVRHVPGMTVIEDPLAHDLAVEAAHVRDMFGTNAAAETYGSQLTAAQRVELSIPAEPQHTAEEKAADAQRREWAEAAVRAHRIL